MAGALIPVVLSGIAGKFPESDGLEEFFSNLYNAVDMVTDCRRGWNTEAHKIPGRMGQLKNLDRFDADFFGVHSKQAENMDPRLRFLLEVSHASIIDAGINPVELSGSNAGVYVGACGEEAIEYYKGSSETPSGYAVTGTLLSTLSNRLSFNFNLRGPSFSMDTACSSSLLALEQAVSAIRLGKCDSALVAGVSLCLDPRTTTLFTNLGMTSVDGKCKSFDSTADGYVRSEAAVVVYVCKEEAARRCYATVLHVGNNTDGYKANGFTYPSGEIQEKLLRQVYAEAGINPNDVGYIEAHGTGTQAGDFEEINAITRVFCTDRDPDRPLLLGSVKSNMGHSEPASGLCGVAKLVMIAQTRVIPGNLHFSTPNPRIPALLNGRIKIVVSNTPFEGELVALNSFGFGGSNVHAILKFPAKQTEPKWSPQIPVVMPLSGRTVEVAASLKKLAATENKMVAPLLHSIARFDIPGHGFRSYAIVNCPELGAVSLHSSEGKIQKEGRPLWFVFSGTGTQYKGMVLDMMALEAFQNSIQNSIQMFSGQGFDLGKVLFTEDDEALNDVRNSAVSIVAIQIALVDLLESVGVVPEMIVGHSLGEVAAAYSDNCLTAEQALTVTFIRSRAFRDSIPGAMASVGLSWDEALEQCPSDVFLACDNSAENVTISGNAESVDKFVSELQRKEIFARNIQSSGMAFHSIHMNPSAKYMREHLPRIIPEPKLRSQKWISTSAPESEKSSSLYQMCSVDYWINNALAPVRFRGAIELMPENAVAIEIGPHGVLQAILKRALPPTVTNIGVMSKNVGNNCHFFLEALGKLYLTGHNPNFGALYERVTFPLGPSTPMISPVIQWDHSKSWIVPLRKETVVGGSRIQICPKNESDSFYLDHIIDGRTIFPGAGYMFIVWSSFAKRQGKNLESCPVTFDNVRFERSTPIYADATTEFHITIQPGSGDFEVYQGDSSVCRGRIQELGSSTTMIPMDWNETHRGEDSPSCSITNDFYKIARLRGYGHQGVFRSIRKADPSGEWVEIEWQRNWVALIDNLLQLNLIFQRHEGMVLPIRIQNARFHPQKLLEFVNEGKGTYIPAEAIKNLDAVVAPGFEIRGLKAALAPRREQLQVPTLSAYKWFPFVNLEEASLGFEEYLGFCIEIAMDNTPGSDFIVLEFKKQNQSPCSNLKDRFPPKFESFEWVVRDHKQEPSPDWEQPSTTHHKRKDSTISPNLVIVTVKDILLAEEHLGHENFLLCIDQNATEPLKCLKGYWTIAQQPGLALYRRKYVTIHQAFKAIEVKCSNFDWVELIKSELIHKNETPRLYLYSHSCNSGLQGLVRCLRKEGYNQLRCFEVLDEKLAFNFGSPNRSLEEIIELDLVYNVYSSKGWGCFKSMPFTIVSKGVVNALDSQSTVDIRKPGDLSTLSWIESPLEMVSRGREQLLCQVSYSALNFRDVMLATGKLSRDAIPGDFTSNESVLGVEYSGVIPDGTRIFGMRSGKCLATAVEFSDDFGLSWPVPKHWTLAEAATVPIAYGTAYYALVVKGRIREGETVLIHSGAGGVGQAAITVALSRKARVITTVSSDEKRAYLKSRFPQLTDACFANSRDPVAFESHVMEVTNGRGVDVVLNSLSQESLQASARCLGSGGRFLEIGKFDLFNNSELGMALFLKSIEFHGVLLDYLMQPQLSTAALEEKKMVKDFITEGINAGIIAPLPYTEYCHSQLEEAFRFMSSGKHLGKILIKVRDDPLASPNIPALPRTYFYPHKVYILVGGLGGMGLEIANWMVNCGAKHLVLVSRSGVRTWYQKYRIHAWRAKDISITISTCDATRPGGVHSLLEMATKIGPIGGIFNLAVELRDGLLVNQTSDKFQVVAKPKILATELLDKFARELAPNVDYFVVFSSVACLIGNAGQSSYGYANSVIERVCMQRRAAGLHGLAIQWGPIGDVGIYHSQTGGEEPSIVGCDPQRIASVLEVMNLVLKSSEAVVSSFVPESKLHKGETEADTSLEQLVAHALGITDHGKVNPGDTFSDLGLDSLVGTEIKQLLEKHLNTRMSTESIRSMTFAKLVEMEMKKGKRPGYIEEEEGSSLFGQTPLVLPESTLVSMESKRIKPFNLFLVHPVEGNVRMLEGLVKDINCRVYGIECTPEAPLSSIPALASHYIESIKTVQADGPYRLAGYSYGGAVACEIAIQLEGSGEAVEQLVLLDGSPKIPNMFSQAFSKDVKIGGEALWLMGFLMFHSPQQMEQVESEIMALSTWEDQLDFASEKLAQLYPTIRLQDIRNLGMSFVNRITAGCRYSPKARIKCKTALIRAGKTGFDALMGKDYGLNEICTSNVRVIVVNGNHKSFCEKPTELNIAKIVNDIFK